MIAFRLFAPILLLLACTPEAPEFSAEEIALNNRGVALMGYFDYRGAHTVFEELLTARPDWSGARINLAVALTNRQQPGDELLALEQLETVLAENPDDERANYVSAILHLYLGEIDAATVSFQAVLKVDPQDAYATYYLGQCHLQSGDLEAALSAYERAIELDPYLRSAYYGAALVLRRLGRTEHAREQLQLYERFKNNPRARLAEFKYTRMGPKSLALALGDESGDRDPPAPPVGANRGRSIVLRSSRAPTWIWRRSICAAMGVSSCCCWVLASSRRSRLTTSWKARVWSRNAFAAGCRFRS